MINEEKVLSLLQEQHEKYLRSFVSKGKLSPVYFEMLKEYGKVKLEEDKEINLIYVKKFIEDLYEREIYISRKEPIKKIEIWNNDRNDISCNLFVRDENELFMMEEGSKTKELKISNWDAETVAKLITFENPFLINNCNEYSLNSAVLLNFMKNNGLYEKWYSHLPSMKDFWVNGKDIDSEKWIANEIQLIQKNQNIKSQKILMDLYELSKKDKNLSEYGTYWSSLFESVIKIKDLGFLRVDKRVIFEARRLNILLRRGKLSLSNEDFDCLSSKGLQKCIDVDDFLSDVSDFNYALTKENPGFDKFSENYFLLMLLFLRSYKDFQERMRYKEAMNNVTENDLENREKMICLDSFLSIKNIKEQITDFLKDERNKPYQKIFENKIKNVFQLLAIKNLKNNTLELNAETKRQVIIEVNLSDLERYINVEYITKDWIFFMNKKINSVKIDAGKVKEDRIETLSIMFKDQYINEENYKDTLGVLIKEIILWGESIPQNYGEILDLKIKESILRERLKNSEKNNNTIINIKKKI